MKAELYTRPGCSYCVKAKQLLDSEQIDYTTVDLSKGSATEQSEAREGLIERIVAATGKTPTTMPQIFIDGGYIGGYDQLVEYLKV